jgi:SSS family solute:Na+ symporter
VLASLYSGYTVIGVPNEAFQNGWSALRWIPTLMSVMTGYFGTGLRLRKSSMLRNHQSPVDFITDRYQSQMLRYTIVFLQVLPAIFYLAAQVTAIKATFNSIFELDPDTAYPVIIIMLLIVIFEWVGGLNSVAITDSFQAIVMVLSFIIIPSVIYKHFGGYRDLDPGTYPQPQFYQTLSREKQWDFWQFSLINFSFFTLPHFMQVRTYSGRGFRLEVRSL